MTQHKPAHYLKNEGDSMQLSTLDFIFDEAYYVISDV